MPILNQHMKQMVERGAVFEEFVAFFARRKLPDAPRRIKSIVIISVVCAKSLISPAYDEGAIEQDAVAQWSRHYAGRDRSASAFEREDS